jgi:hypothetical protein
VVVDAIITGLETLLTLLGSVSVIVFVVVPTVDIKYTLPATKPVNELNNPLDVILNVFASITVTQPTLSDVFGLAAFANAYTPAVVV